MAESIMELIIIVATLIVGFAIFTVFIYFMVKLFFPKLEDPNDNYYTPVAKKGLSTGNRNPYSFPKGNA
jgi:hypothetical protein